MTLPTKLHIPPSMCNPLDIAYAEGWNAVCDSFFNGLPPQEPVIITVEREVVRPADDYKTWYDEAMCASNGDMPARLHKRP